MPGWPASRCRTVHSSKSVPGAGVQNDVSRTFQASVSPRATKVPRACRTGSNVGPSPPPPPPRVSNTTDAAANSNVSFAGHAIAGANIGFSSDNCWGFENSQAYRADVTPYVSGNGTYDLASFIKEKGFTQESTPLLGNSLVIVVPWGNPARVRMPQDLTRPEVKHLAVAGPTVPAGIYARQALQKLGLWSELEGRVVSGENVRVTLAFVELIKRQRVLVRLETIRRREVLVVTSDLGDADLFETAGK